jgi:hypothetical protein
MSREAWVHRSFSGRVGPVFVDDSYEPHPELTDLTLFHARPVHGPVLLGADGDREPLPRRTAEPAPAVSRVFTRLSEGEEPRVVVVDGRPPRRGAALPTTAPEGVVVPLKSAHATG